MFPDKARELFSVLKASPHWRWVVGLLVRHGRANAVRVDVTTLRYIEVGGSVGVVPVLDDEVTAAWVVHLVSEAHPSHYARHEPSGDVAIYLADKVVGRGRTPLEAWLQIAGGAP